MIKQQLHSLHDLQELLCTELRLTTLYQALVELKDDSAFNDLPFSEQMYQVATVCKAKRLENRYKNLKRKSNMTSSAVLPVPDTVAKDCGLTPSKMQLIVDKILEKSFQVIIITGACGVGKTTLGITLLELALRQGKKAFYSDYALQMYNISNFYADRAKYAEQIVKVSSQDVVMLDDVFMGISFENEPCCLKDLIDSCILNRCTLLLVTQKDVGDWYDYLNKCNPELVLTVEAFIDRVTESPIIVNLDGESRRQNKNGAVTIKASIKQFKDSLDKPSKETSKPKKEVKTNG